MPCIDASTHSSPCSFFSLVALGRGLTPALPQSGTLLAIENPAGTQEVLLSIDGPVGTAIPPTPETSAAVDEALLVLELPGTEAQPSDAAANNAAFVEAVASIYGNALRPAAARDISAIANATLYSITLDIQPQQRRVFGLQRIRYVNRSQVALNEIVFRLYPNTPYMGGALRITSARYNGRTAALTLDSGDPSIARLAATSALAPGAGVIVDLSFEVTVPDDPKTAYATFGWTAGVLSLPNAYALVPPLDQAGQWRIDPLPLFGDIVASDVAAYRVRIRAPSRYQVVATGECASRIDGAFTWSECSAAPVRDFAIHASDGYQRLEKAVDSIDGGSIKLRVVFLRTDQAAAQRALVYAVDALRSFETLFGAYPYTTLTVFQSTTPIGGIEYPMVAGVTPFKNDEAYFEWLVAHEIAHQWWYGLVGSDPVREAWLDEALTQYSTLLYARERSGARVADLRRSRFFLERWRLEVEARGDARAGQPTNAFARRGYAPIVYGKAPLFFDQVETEVGTERLLAWLRLYAAAGRYRIVTAGELLDAADQTGIGPQVRAAHARWIGGVDNGTP